MSATRCSEHKTRDDHSRVVDRSMIAGAKGPRVRPDRDRPRLVWVQAADGQALMSAPASPPLKPERDGLLTYDPKTGAACVVRRGWQVSLGRHQTLYAAYASAREDGHRPDRWAPRLGAATLRLDQADHWDRLIDSGKS